MNTTPSNITQPRSLFVTGTDTEIGKTLVSAALLRGFSRAGLRAAAMKPIAAGAFERDGVWHNEDADQLDAAASVLLPPDIRTPYLLKEPAAPHIAAALEHVTLDPARIVACHADAMQRADVVVVEGVGGFRVPLHGHPATPPTSPACSACPCCSWWACGWAASVTRCSLRKPSPPAGCVSRAGWPIASTPPSTFADENIAALRERLGREHDAPLVGVVPHLASPSADAAADCLDTASLLQTLHALDISRRSPLNTQ